MSRHQTFLWSNAQLIESASPPVKSVIAADSWRLEDGHVVWLDHHVKRFFAGITPHTRLHDSSRRFVQAVLGQLPTKGSWFPRIDLIDSGAEWVFRYQQRPRPAVSDRAVLATARLDPRKHPHTKGPDLEALLALRGEASERGADEAIIVRNGYVCEGAYSTVMAWSPDGRTLYSMGPEEPRIPSVTESVISEIASTHGVATVQERFRPADLDGLEVWIVSALHGIRHAVAWVDGPSLVATSGRREEYQREWFNRSSALTDAADSAG
jgi:branched-subunit amino acid aminotransferase/4-amino-4-deoxychorismate lyase